MKEEAIKAYNAILKLVKKHESICIFDYEEMARKSKSHLFGLELKETYGLNVSPEKINSLDWVRFGDYVTIGWYDGERRYISFLDEGQQPKNIYLIKISFPAGPYIFGDGVGFDKDYPVDFFQRFWNELKTYGPDFIDSANSSLFWKLENGKEIFNSFDYILKKYHDLNKEDIKQRRVRKMEEELNALKASDNI